MKTLILVGGGHAHLHCLAQLQKQSDGYSVMLISPSRLQFYSGMLSGFAEGIYTAEEISVDLPALAIACGAQYVEDTIVGIDPVRKQLSGKSGAVYPYDLVSFATGSTVSLPSAVKEAVQPPKPNDRLIRLIERLKETDRPVIIGGGAAGTELALSLHAIRQKSRRPPPLLLSSGALLDGSGRRISRKAEAVATAKGLPFRTGSPAKEVGPDSVTDTSGQRFTQSELLWMGGPAGFPLFRESALPTDDNGFLLVDEQLQSIAAPDIFGAGDCVSLVRYPALPKNGVHAVRQGPILWHNLRARMTGGNLQRYIPQKRMLAILSTGNGEALLLYGGFALHGKFAWKLKTRIDRQFLARFRRIYE